MIATVFSGNMEFMNPEVSFSVNYSLLSVTAGEYPHYENQIWADPDIEDAAIYMIKFIDDPESGRAVGKKARLHIKKNFSYLAIGLGYRLRLDKVSELI